MHKTSLLRHFTFYSLIAFILTGLSLGFFISNHIRNDMISSLEETTHLVLNTIVEPELIATKFDKPLLEEKILVLNNKLDSLSKLHNIIAVKIWNRSPF